MPRIYVSSTYEDLADEREAVYHILRKMNFDVVAMEDYVAADERPLDRCLADVASCDAYVGIFAWRYGYIPQGKDQSITELEFREAERTKKNCLLFMLDENVLWLPKFTDKDNRIETFRNELKKERIVSFFKTKDDLAALASVAVGKLNLSMSATTSYPSAKLELNDATVNNVLLHLRKLHQELGQEFLPAEVLLPELELLFNRKTFRFEELRNCPEQRWSDRLDSAYQTHTLLECYARNIKKTAPDKYPLYQKLLKAVEDYCMQMGTLLFQPSVDYNEIENHIGKKTFKGLLPPQIRFPEGQSKQPIIPDYVNDPIETHRRLIIRLIDRITKK